MDQLLSTLLVGEFKSEIAMVCVEPNARVLVSYCVAVKFGGELNFGSLVVCICNCQIKIHQYFTIPGRYCEVWTVKCINSSQIFPVININYGDMELVKGVPASRNVQQYM